MNADVVVVGAGPSGLMLACELGLAGIPTIVVEQHGTARTDVPGVALNAGAVELLDDRGLLSAVKAAGYTAPLPNAHFALMPLRTEALPARYRNSLIVTQDVLQGVLEERATELGVTVLRGHAVRAVEQDAESVRVTVGTEAGERRLAARYLVGCDGSDSSVRELMGIRFLGVERPFAGLVGDIEIPLSRLSPAHLGAYYSDAGGVYMCLPIGKDVVRLITAEYDPVEVMDTASVPWSETLSTVARLTGVPLEGARQRWMSRYRDRCAVAERYRVDRVFLAGDAAHTVFPLNGQAITTALHDVVNLGWKLAGVLQGRLPEAVLETYSSERAPVGRLVWDNIEAQVALCKDPSQVSSLRGLLGRLIELPEVNEYLTELLMGVGVRYAMAGDDHPLLGRRLPPLQLKTSSGELWLAEILAAGRGCLIDLSGGALAAAATGWAGRVNMVTAVQPPELDVPGLLLRPDGHVCWVAVSGAAGLPAALTTWFGAGT